MAIASKEAKTFTGTVYVGCKLPHGLKLQLTKPREEKENVLGGGVRTFTIHRRQPEFFKLNGVALAKGERPRFTLTNGAAVTKVPAKFWNEWFEQNKDSDVVRHGLVFAQGSEIDVRAQAKELKGEKSGFEPINTETDAKGRSIDPRMRGVRTKPKQEPQDEDEDAVEEA